MAHLRSSLRFLNRNFIFLAYLQDAEVLLYSKNNDQLKTWKTQWPRRDLNTQPSDLESDALPLRHGVHIYSQGLYWLRVLEIWHMISENQYTIISWVHWDFLNCTFVRGRKEKLAQSAGFEPARAEPNGFLVHRLNHSATTAMKNGSLKCVVNITLSL